MMWIGLTDKEKAGEFRWISGKYSSFNVSRHWADGQPNSDKEHCVGVNSYDPPTLHDFNCNTDKLDVVCQKQDKLGKFKCRHAP